MLIRRVVAVIVVLALIVAGGLLWMRITRAPRLPLGLAAHHGDVAALRALLAAGADPNEPDATGYTPLGWAARGGHPLGPHWCQPDDAAHLEAIRVLLAAGADPRLPATRDGWTPEDVARHHQQVQAAALLTR